MTINLRAILVMSVIAAAAVFMATTALAANNDDGSRPGWGYGDKNHVHTGPPGQSVHP